MPNYKHYSYDQSVLLPINFDEQFIPGTLVFAINYLIERRIDCSVFDKKYKNDDSGCTAFNPKILLKIILYAYALGITGSRKIAHLCQKHIEFIALAGGLQPRKSTIAAFVSSMGSEIDTIFESVLLICEEEDLLGGTTFALDGVKLPSNASKHWSGTHDELKHKRDKIRQRLALLKQEHLQQDEDEEKSLSLEEKREQQIKKLQQQEQKISSFLTNTSPKNGRKKKEIKSNVTDNESAKMTTSKGTIQGYNANSLTDDKRQVVIYGEAFGNGQDYSHVIPMIDGAKKTMIAIGHSGDYFEQKVLTADTSFHSEDNLEKCRDEKIDAYIPDNYFRDRDPRFSEQYKHKPGKKKKYTIEDFEYTPASDTYLCPNKKHLLKNADNVKQSGKYYARYAADEKDCKSCRLRDNCLVKSNAKRRLVMKFIRRDETSLSNQMIDKIDTEKGRQIYGKRFSTVEPVFGNICSNKGLRRFSLRGKEKVTVQWKLFCLVHNIEKIVNYGGLYLHENAHA